MSENGAVHIITLDPSQQLALREVMLNYVKNHANDMIIKVNTDGRTGKIVSRKDTDKMEELIDLLEGATAGLASSLWYNQAKARMMYMTASAMKHAKNAVQVFVPDRDVHDRSVATIVKNAFPRLKALVMTASQFTYTADEIKKASRAT